MNVHIDRVTVGLVLAILLLGLVMVTSASISIAGKETGDVFLYLERQLVLAMIGFVTAAFVFLRAPRDSSRSISMPLLIAPVVLLLLVRSPASGTR